MSTSRRVLAIAGNTARGALRGKVLYSLLLFFLCVGLLSVILSNLTIGWQLRIVTDLSVSAATSIGSIIALLLGVSSVATEKDRQTLVPVLAKPGTRAEWIVGKYAGVCAVTVGVGSAMYLCSGFLISAFSHESFFGYSLTSYSVTAGLALTKLLLIAALAVAFSCVVSPAVAIVAAGGIAIAGHFTSDLRFFFARSDSNFTKIVGEFLYWLLPDLSMLDTLPMLLHHRPMQAEPLLLAATHALLYAAGAVALSTAVFSKRDLR